MALAPHKTALLVIDVQSEYFGSSRTIGARDSA